METSFDETIGLQANQMQKKMLRYLNRSLEWYGITLEQWVVLSAISENESINQKSLSAKIEKDPTSLLRILDILEKKGLVERRPFQGDRRASSLFITGRGKHLRSEVAPYIENRFKEITSNVSESEIEIYEKVLGQICRNLDELLKK